MPILVSVVKRIDPCCKTRSSACACGLSRCRKIPPCTLCHPSPPISSPPTFFSIPYFLALSLSLPFFCSNNSLIPQELGKDCMIEKTCRVLSSANLVRTNFFPLVPFRQYIIFLYFLPFARNSCAIGGSFVLNLDNTPRHCGLTQRLLCLVLKLHCNRQKLQPQCCLKELLKRKIAQKDSRNESESSITASCQKWKCIKSVFCISFYRLPSLPPHHHHHTVCLV